MLLGRRHIMQAIDFGPWTAHRDGRRITSDELTINPNSVNVSLGNKSLWPTIKGSSEFIDPYRPELLSWDTREFEELHIMPTEFALMSVRERFDCSAPLIVNGQEKYFAPMIEGRSTAARCGLSVHSTAGFGDHGFSSTFTLEVTTSLPITLRAGDEIAQVFFIEVSDGSARYDGAYTDQNDEPRAPVLGEERFQRFN